MATRSLIGKLDSETKKVKYIYCHYDGHLDHNGRILVDHYNTPEKVDQLLELGNLSVLGPEIGEKQDFNSHQNNKNYCLAFGRDRGEKKQEARTVLLEDYKSEYVSYVYLYTNEGWKWNRVDDYAWKSVQSYLEVNA